MTGEKSFCGRFSKEQEARIHKHRDRLAKERGKASLSDAIRDLVLGGLETAGKKGKK